VGDAVPVTLAADQLEADLLGDRVRGVLVRCVVVETGEDRVLGVRKDRREAW
jgi:hypothetical protein